MSAVLKQETLGFLSDLKNHNDREWFNAHKDRYLAAQENFLEFLQALIEEIATFDQSVVGLNPKDCVFRIYRDTRFSKDKTPYKTCFSASLMQGKGPHGTAGYYVHLEPGGNSMLAGGAYMIDTPQIKALRQEIVYNAGKFLAIINDETFLRNFELKGEKLKNVPPGYDKNDPMAEYLKYKSLYVYHKMSDETLLSGSFAAYCGGIYKSMRPFSGFIQEAISTEAS